jgi:hypothetical protein
VNTPEGAVWFKKVLTNVGMTRGNSLLKNNQFCVKLDSTLWHRYSPFAARDSGLQEKKT